MNNKFFKLRDIEIPIIKEYTNLVDINILQELRKEFKGKALIYAIHRNNSTDLYVGSTIKPETRFYNHLLKGKDSSLRLQNAFKKYGKQNFTLYILTFVNLNYTNSKKERDLIMISLAQQGYMDLLKPIQDAKASAGRNRLGMKHTEFSKILMSQNMIGKNVGKTPINKGKILTLEEKEKLIIASKKRSKPVYIYDEHKNLITLYESLNIAYKIKKTSKSFLLNCIKKNKLFKGWIISYLSL